MISFILRERTVNTSRLGLVLWCAFSARTSQKMFILDVSGFDCWFNNHAPRTCGRDDSLAPTNACHSRDQQQRQSIRMVPSVDVQSS